MFPSKKRILASFWILLWGFSFAQVLEIQASGTGATEEEAILEAKKNLAMRIARDLPHEKIFAEMVKTKGNEALERAPLINTLSDDTIQAIYRIFSTDIDHYIEVLDNFVATIDDGKNNINGKTIAEQMEITEQQMDCYVRYIPLVNAVKSLGGTYKHKPKLSYETISLRLKMLNTLKDTSSGNTTEDPFGTIQKIEEEKKDYIVAMRAATDVQAESLSEDSPAERTNSPENQALRNKITGRIKELEGKTFRAESGGDLLHLDTAKNEDGSWNYLVAFQIGDKIAFLNEGSFKPDSQPDLKATATYKAQSEHFYSIRYLVSPISCQVLNSGNNVINRKNFSANDVTLIFTEKSKGIFLTTGDILPFAKSGDKQAQYILANMYKKEGNFSEAIYWLEPLMKENYRDSVDLYDEVLLEMLQHQAMNKKKLQNQVSQETGKTAEEKKFPVNFALGIVADLLATIDNEVLSDDFFNNAGVSPDVRGKSFFSNKFNPHIGIFFLAEYTVDFFKRPAGQFAVSCHPEFTWTMKTLKKGDLFVLNDGTYYSAEYSYHTLNLTIPVRISFAGFFFAIGPGFDFSLGNFPFIITEERADAFTHVVTDRKSGNFKTAGVSMRLSMELGYQFAFEHIICSVGVKAMPQIAENTLKRTLISENTEFDFFAQEPRWLLGGTIKIGYRF